MLGLTENLKIAEYNLKSTTSRFKTHINMNLTLPQYTETVRQWEDSTGISFYPVKQLNYATRLTINQPLPTDGNIYIQTGLSNYEDYFSDLRSSNLNTRIGFTQPLDAFYGYNQIRSAYKLAQLAYEKSNKLYKREEALLVYNVSSYYYNLLSIQKRTEIAFMNLERQTEAFEISQKKYEAGLIREVDALQMEVDLAAAQNSYEGELQNQFEAINSFKNMLGLDLRDSLILSSELKYKVVAIDPEKAVRLAIENRPEIRDREIEIAEQELNIKRQKAEGMVRGSIDAYFEKVGVSRQDIDLSLGTSIKNSYKDFTNRPSNFGVGLTVTIPILDWGENKALVRAAQARLKQAAYNKEEEERNIETEVRNLVASLGSYLKRLQSLEKNVAVAEKSFQITLQRYSDGDIDSQSLALERDRLNSAYTTHLGAYIEYQRALANLTYQTFYDFQKEELVQ